jgi:hypothetical protein
MRRQLGVIGALSVCSSLAGGVLLAGGDATGSAVLDGIGAVLLIGGVLSFFAIAIQRSRREGRGLLDALARSGKDALRLTWYVFKSA